MNKNKWFLNGGRGSGRAIRLLCETYENRIADLEQENAEHILDEDWDESDPPEPDYDYYEEREMERWESELDRCGL